MILLFAETAFSHSTGDIASASGGGFLAGFLHPVSGLDHVVAMVAVGLWGAFLGAPAIWLLPVVFPMVMAFGGVLGIAGVPVPAVEILIAISGIVLGIMVATKAKPPIYVAAIIVGIFAIFHGYAHGEELPEAAEPLAYSIGFVSATGLIHIGGISLGLLTKWKSGLLAIRILGGLICLVGFYFLKIALF
ncbi:MAG: HupE/UreJ family protein [Deltaproteobacteria bacterium]|nr:HupE/UreJ family protein [Deltaproteobacteria bacterium]